MPKPTFDNHNQIKRGKSTCTVHLDTTGDTQNNITDYAVNAQPKLVYHHWVQSGVLHRHKLRTQLLISSSLQSHIYSLPQNMGERLLFSQTGNTHHYFWQQQADVFMYCFRLWLTDNTCNNNHTDTKRFECLQVHKKLPSGPAIKQRHEGRSLKMHDLPTIKQLLPRRFFQDLQCSCTSVLMAISAGQQTICSIDALAAS